MKQSKFVCLLMALIAFGLSSCGNKPATTEEAPVAEVAPEILNMAEWKGFDKPDEVREFPNGKLEMIKIGGAMIGRGTFEPGWKWSTSVQPLAKTHSCEAPHFQYHVSGILRVKMDDGTEFDCKPGDVSLLPSGHDAWTVGDVPAVVIDFQGMVDYAKQLK